MNTTCHHDGTPAGMECPRCGRLNLNRRGEPIASVPVRVPPDMNREQWRWWFAGQQMASYARLGHTEEKASRWAVRDADALLAELERTSP